MIRVAYVGCVRSSDRLLHALLSRRDARDHAEVVLVVSRSSSPMNSDHVSLIPRAERAGIPWHDYEPSAKEHAWERIRAAQPDVIFCFGWSSLLPPDLIDEPRLGTVGFHPTALPLHRGRHPVIWALALGLDWTASSFFRMVAEPDAGPIISQIPVPIYRSDYVSDLYDRICSIASEQVVEVARLLDDPSFVPRSQIGPSSSWRRRTEEDCTIDWRMASAGIYDLVRALSHPYPGAQVRGLGRVWMSEVSGYYQPGDVGVEPGKVVRVDEGGDVVVKCGRGWDAIRLTSYEFSRRPMVGEYLL